MDCLGRFTVCKITAVTLSEISALTDCRSSLALIRSAFACFNAKEVTKCRAFVGFNSYHEFNLGM